jgi:hypothetical protein
MALPTDSFPSIRGTLQPAFRIGKESDAAAVQLEKSAGVLRIQNSLGTNRAPAEVFTLSLLDVGAGTALFIDSADGQTAPVSALTHGRLRYNNATEEWEQSTNGSAYRSFSPPLTVVALGPFLSNPWTNMPAAASAQCLVLGTVQARYKNDLSGYTEARLVVSIGTAGFAGAKLGVQYSTDTGATWLYLDNTPDGPVGSAAPQVSLTATGLVESAWMSLAAGAMADVWLRLIGSDGNGIVDPIFIFALEVR